MTNRTLASSLLFALALAPLGAQPAPGMECKHRKPHPSVEGGPSAKRLETPDFAPHKQDGHKVAAQARHPAPARPRVLRGQT